MGNLIHIRYFSLGLSIFSFSITTTSIQLLFCHPFKLTSFWFMAVGISLEINKRERGIVCHRSACSFVCQFCWLEDEEMTHFILYIYATLWKIYVKPKPSHKTKHQTVILEYSPSPLPSLKACRIFCLFLYPLPHHNHHTEKIWNQSCTYIGKVIKKRQKYHVYFQGESGFLKLKPPHQTKNEQFYFYFLSFALFFALFITLPWILHCSLRKFSWHGGGGSGVCFSLLCFVIWLRRCKCSKHLCMCNHPSPFLLPNNNNITAKSAKLYL